MTTGKRAVVAQFYSCQPAPNGSKPFHMQIKTFGIAVAVVLVAEAVVLAIPCLFPPKHPHELVYPAGSLDQAHCAGVLAGIKNYETAHQPVPQLYKIVQGDTGNGPSRQPVGDLQNMLLEDSVSDPANIHPTAGGCAVQVGIGLAKGQYDNCILQPNSSAVHSHFIQAITQSKDLVEAVQNELAKLNQPRPQPTP